MNSLIFFVLIIGIDILLKSVKEKKKVQESRKNQMYQFKKKETFKEAETMVKKNTSFDKVERYKDLYQEVSQSHEKIKDTYTDLRDYDFEKAFYDKDAIKTRKKEYKDLDIRDYGKTNNKIDISITKASTFKEDILKGIIFSEILGKPKSIQNRHI